MDEFNKMSLEELINAYLDDQLSERHKTELKRLIRHDKHMEEKVRMMERQKKLIHSLPHEKAPEHLLADIKASIERKALLDEYQDNASELVGSKHLVFRHLSSMAAVLALAACLGYVIWSVVAPVGNGKKDAPQVVSLMMEEAPVEVEPPATAKKAVVRSMAVLKAPVPIPLNLKLKIYTSDAVHADRMVSQAIYNNNLINSANISRQLGKTEYVISAQRDQLLEMIRDVAVVWNEAQSSDLIVSGHTLASQQQVSGITSDQLIKLFEQKDQEDIVILSENFVLFNRIAQNMPGREFLDQFDKPAADLPAIPKPVMTSPALMDTAPAKPVGPNIDLVIEVISQ